MAERKIHPFARTLGPGPYKWVGCFDLGAAISAQQSGNTMGFSNIMAQAPRVKAGMGTCAHCGMAILNVHIVEVANGDLYGVGCECIRKTANEGDFTGLTEMERKVKEDRRIKNKKARETRRLKKAQALGKKLEDHKDRLKNLPHPSKFFQEKTAWDYATFLYRKGHLSENSCKYLENFLQKVLA